MKISYESSHIKSWFKCVWAQHPLYPSTTSHMKPPLIDITSPLFPPPLFLLPPLLDAMTLAADTVVYSKSSSSFPRSIGMGYLLTGFSSFFGWLNENMGPVCYGKVYFLLFLLLWLELGGGPPRVGKSCLSTIRFTYFWSMLENFFSLSSSAFYCAFLLLPKTFASQDY